MAFCMTSFSQALAVRQMASHLTQEYFGIQRSSWWTARCPGLRTSPNHQPSTTVLDSWYDMFGFLQTCCCALWPNISTLVWSVQRTLFQKSCGLFRCIFTNLSCAAMLLFREKRLSPATLPNKPYLFSLFLIVLSWTLTSNMLTEACRVWDVALGFLTLTWDVHSWDDWQLSLMFSTCEYFFSL